MSSAVIIAAVLVLLVAFVGMAWLDDHWPGSIP